VHTSTVTVAVIDPKVTEDIVFNDKDFVIEWYSGTGAGGQHRNKHQNSCRITYRPTGHIATAQCRSRANSLDEAKKAILGRINGKATNEFLQIESADRKNQVGSGQRGDKVRTYRFQDDVVKDHRTGATASCNKVLNGYFDLMWC
jgi:peptide chain release factor 1